MGLRTSTLDFDICAKLRLLAVMSYLMDALSGGPLWDLISEKYCTVLNGERQIIFVILFELCHESHI